ncbi:MAG TPA: dTDP-4-dehydrorhamnose reductase [Dissulfurispiraceae bacterium]|nr:dTDP-4-dehydrorhamnose reductase [Dissulfurispiraceae bacterium]
MKILITGSGGQLAQEFLKVLPAAGHEVIAPAEQSLDISDRAVVRQTVAASGPDLVLNCAAYNNVDKAEKDDADAAYRVNALGPKNLAAACREYDALMVHYSSDYVFDGLKEDLYAEDDATVPINNYGETKRAGEIFVMEEAAEYLIFRLSWVFGEGRQNFLFKLLEWAKKKRVLKIVSDQVSVPTYTEDIARATMSAVDKDLRGLYHLTNSGYASRYEVARYFLEKAGAENIVLPVTSDLFPSPARRPYFSAMSNSKLASALGYKLPDWKNAVDRHVEKNRNSIKGG